MDVQFSEQVFSEAFVWGQETQFAHPLGIRPSKPQVPYSQERSIAGGALGLGTGALLGAAAAGPIGIPLGMYGVGNLGADIGQGMDDRARQREVSRQEAVNHRLRLNNERGEDDGPAQLPDFLQDPFEGNETGPDLDIWTDAHDRAFRQLAATAHRHSFEDREMYNALVDHPSNPYVHPASARGPRR